MKEICSTHEWFKVSVTDMKDCILYDEACIFMLELLKNCTQISIIQSYINKTNIKACIKYSTENFVIL